MSPQATVNKAQVHQNRLIVNGLLFFCFRFISIWTIHPKFHGCFITTAEFQKLVLCQVSRFFFAEFCRRSHPKSISFNSIQLHPPPFFFTVEKNMQFFDSVDVAEEHVAPKPGQAERCRLAEIVFSLSVLFSRPTSSRSSCQ